MCRGRDWASREDTAPRTGLGKGAPVQGKWELVSRVQRDPVGLPLSPDPTGVALLPAAAPPRASVAGLSGHGGGGCSVLLTERLLYTKRGVYANSTLCNPLHHWRWDTGCVRPHAQLRAEDVSGITFNISNLLLLYYPLCL